MRFAAALALVCLALTAEHGGAAPGRAPRDDDYLLLKIS